MTVVFDDDRLAQNVEAGMTVTVGASSATVSSVGEDGDGTRFALADTTLADGTYQAKVSYKQTQAIRLLLN